MKIIIAGAGDVGFHLAELLASEHQDITLIDTNEEVLEHAATHLDVLTIRGDAASVEALNKADVERARLFLAVTTSETTNLLAAILAKQLGATQTIARVNALEYVSSAQKKRFQKLGIDNLFSPILLAAQEIERLLQRSSFTDIFEFEGGRISVIGITIDLKSPLVGKTLRDIDRDTPDLLIRCISILRNGKTIIPDSSTKPRIGDHLYLVTQKENISAVTSYVGKSLKKIKKVMIAGGSPLAKAVAQMLEKTYSVTLIDPDRGRCKDMVECLDDTLIVKGNPNNIDLLKEEGLDEMDAFLSLTASSETNIVTSLLAKEASVGKTIALVDNSVYIHISHNIGVDTVINKKITAANNIFRFVRKGKVEAISSLHGVDAEVIEFVVHSNNHLTSKTICELDFPDNALIVGIIRGEQTIVPDGNCQMQLNDKVIVFATPKAIGKLESLFQ